MEKEIQRNPKKADGQILVIMAIAMIGLIAAVGLATDATLLYVAKQNLQRSLDSAVLAGSRILPDQTGAAETVYEVMNLHGFDFDPSTNPLTFTFPTYSPPRKALVVEGTTEADFIFLRVVGFNNAAVAAVGEAESAPVDVYMVIDLSMSMVYDTPQPPGWPAQAVGGCTSWSDWVCVTNYCNANDVCDPLDTSIKPAAKFFVDELSSQFDRIGIVTYDHEGVHVLSLAADFNAVKTAIDNLDAYNQMGRSTNIGDGIFFGHQYMAAEGRLDAIWAMVLLTDGRANVYRSCTGCPPSCGAATCQILHDDNHGGPYATTWAIDNAQDTWDRHETVIYTIAYGDIFSVDPSYQDLMIDVADITDNGTLDGVTENFWLAPDQNALRDALEEIAERFFTRLLR